MSSFKDRKVKSLSSDPTFSDVEKRVMVFSPLFAIAAGYVATLVARYFPGITIPRDQLIWAFIGGVSAVVVVVLKFLHSKDKRMQTVLGRLDNELGSLASVVGERVDPEQVFKSLFAEHKAELLAMIEKAVPEQVAAALRTIFSQQATAGAAPPEPAAAAAQTQAGAPAS